ncbi:MAG: polyphosphate polymerase domain-containing protein [Lentisphaerales bacterium]|jgi:hypothetical protein|nr:MAG: polyphosphate polymerase domain-containing protein [Lentisphaerales bacterium]
MPVAPSQSAHNATRQAVSIARHEAKYVIPHALLPKIRSFIAPYCQPDPNCTGAPPEYVITTMQLDTHDLSLHHAKDRESWNRFKLRVRTYGTDNSSPIFAEIKRKLQGMVVKSRARVPRDKWCADLVLDPKRKVDIPFRSDKEAVAFLEFLRLTREIGAVPTVLIRYIRESYISVVDEYARVTFDRNLLYQPTNSWEFWGSDKAWKPIDTSLFQNKLQSFSGHVMELKSLPNVPRWMIEMIRELDLVRTGHCKYSNALWIESLFRATTDTPMYAEELMNP